MAILRFYCFLAVMAGIPYGSQFAKMIYRDYPWAFPLIGACLLANLCYSYPTYGGPTLWRINTTVKARKDLQHIAPTFAELRGAAEYRHKIENAIALREMERHIKQAMTAYTNFMRVAEADF